MSVTVVFGPLAYRMEGVTEAELPPVLVGYVARAGRVEAAPVPISFTPAPLWNDALEGPQTGNGFRLESAPEGDRVRVLPYSPRWPGRGLLAALGELVCRDAPRVGAVAVHAAAVRGPRSLALLLAPPGTGKTTLARAAGEASFAHNAVLAGPGGAWALPFAGDPDPSLDAPGQVPVGLLVELLRADDPTGPGGIFEWGPRGGATTLVMRACARPRGADPFAPQRAMIALELLASLPGARLRVSRPEGAWQVLRSVLASWESVL